MTQSANQAPGDTGATKAELIAQFVALNARVEELEQANVDLQSRNKALNDNQGHLASLVEHMPAVAFVRDLEGRFAIVNRRYEETYAVTNEAVCGKTVGDVFVKKVAEEYAEQDRQVIAENRVVEQEISVDFDGSMHDILSIRFPIGDADGKTVAVGGIEQDITARKQAEVALRENEMRFRTIIDQLPLSFSLKDADDQYLMVNQRFQNWFADKETTVAGKSTSDLYDGAFTKRLVDLDQRVRETGEVSTQEMVQPFADGEMLTTQMTKFPITMEDDDSILVGTIDVDITELKQMQHQLLDSEERFRTLIENTRGIAFRYVLDDDYSLEYIGGNVEQITGYPASDFLETGQGRVRTYASIVHPDDASSIRRDIEEAVDKNCDFTIEYRVLNSDGSSRWVHSIGAPVPDSDGTLKWIDGTLFDITDRKNQEDVLRRSEARMHRILEDSPIAVAISLDDLSEDDGVVQFANSRFLDLMGFSETDIGTARTHSFLAKSSTSREKHEVALDAGESLHNMEQVVVGKDGRDIWTLMSINPIEYGERKAALLWFYDITERKKTEEEVRRTREQMNSILESSPMGIAVTCRDNGNTLYANARLAEQLQLGEDRSIGRDLIATWADLKDREKVLRRARREGFVEDVEVQRRRSDGSSFWALMSNLLISYEGQDAFLSWTYDITERKQTEEALAHQKKILDVVFENMQQGVGMFDDWNKLVAWNRRYQEVLGFDDAVMLPDQDLIVLLEDLSARGHYGDGDSKSLVQERLEYLTDGKVRRSELVVHDQTYDVQKRPLSEGGFVITYADITEEKRAANELRIAKEEAETALAAQLESEQSAQRLREAIEVFSDSIVLYDKNERVVFTNNRYHELYPNSPPREDIAGHSQEELLYLSLQNGLIDDPLAKSDPEAWLAKRLQERRESRSFSGETDHSNGRTYLLRHRPTTDGGLIVAHTDITERKKAEDRFRSLLESAPDATVIVNADGSIVQANLQSEKLFGYAPEELLGKKIEMLLPNRFRNGHPALRNQFFGNAAARPMGVGLELYCEAKNGREFPIEISLSPIETVEGTLVSASIRDITERKQAERELRVAKEGAEAALAGLKQTQARLVQTEKMASLGELTAGIAHEIKNPLNFVNNFSETSVELLDELKEALEPVQGNLDEDTRDDVDDIFGTLKGDLEKINHHGRRADNIVKSMLLHARGEASERVLTQVNDLVEEALNLAYHGERARDKNFHATLQQDFDDTAGQAKLIPQEVTRVLVNLFSNAFYAVKTRARDGGPGTYAPTVSVWTEDKGGNVQIRIRDNGTGIPEDVREKLFDPFFTTKPTGEGTGLGLSMSFDIIAQQHDGQINVNSEPGEFTEFTITLPRHLDGTSQLSDKGNQI